jgi:Clr5 domain
MRWPKLLPLPTVITALPLDSFQRSIASPQAGRLTLLKMNHENAFLKYFGPQLRTTRRAQQLPIDEWTPHREVIKTLYIDQDKTLNEVVDIMKRDHGFQAKLGVFSPT